MSTGIGAVIITRNEESEIAHCLRALSFCDERVVVDSFSDDATVQRALPYAEHVYRRRFLSHAEQKNWALERLETPWALVVDADERVTPALAQELIDAARNPVADGYWLLRRNTFFGRTIRGSGWHRDRVLRFFRRDRGRYDERLVHEEVAMATGAAIATCRQRLVHHSYQTWSSTFERLLSYTSRGARDRAERGRSPSSARVVLAPLARFLRQYLLQAGFRDGLHGYVLCTWSAVGIFLRESKLRLGELEVPAVGGIPGDPGGVEVEVIQGRPVEGAKAAPAAELPDEETHG